jgi:GxxExxY protein
MTELLYPDLSYKIVGCAYETYNLLGKGRPEKFYQKGMAAMLSKAGLKFKEQVYYCEKIEDRKIGTTYFDFFVEDLVVVEIKQGEHFSAANFEQIKNYLKMNNCKLGILINFTSKEVKVRRVLNLY